jgi:rhodanese-related sulfurtransferase
LDPYEEAVSFINSFKDKNEKVYVHCKAGHGRGAAVAFVSFIVNHLNFCYFTNIRYFHYSINLIHLDNFYLYFIIN